MHTQRHGGSKNYNVPKRRYYTKEDHRELAWHDLAFFNAELYEGFRRMMLDAELGRMTKDEFQQVYCCYFEVRETTWRHWRGRD